MMTSDPGSSVIQTRVGNLKRDRIALHTLASSAIQLRADDKQMKGSTGP
jgi:hypothetical protein